MDLIESKTFDLTFIYTEDKLLKLQQSYNVAHVEVKGKYIYVSLDTCNKYFLQTKQLTKSYLKKFLLS